MERYGAKEIGHDGVWMDVVNVSGYAGAYVIGREECFIWLRVRPAWWVRWWVHFLLGWRWVDVPWEVRAVMPYYRSAAPPPAPPQSGSGVTE